MNAVQDEEAAQDDAPQGEVPQARAGFSVVIPLYNKAPLIAATLESALADRERVLEVIVVDDGSTDDSAAVVERFDDPRIRLIRQANGGVSRARNRGIEAARGEWIAFLDADDLWAPGYLERLEELARTYPDCGMLATGYMTDDEGDEAHRHILDHPDAASLLASASPRRIDDYLDFVTGGQICCTISTAVRRSLVIDEGLRFPEGEHLGEDLDFFLCVAERTSLAYSPEPLAIYVQSQAVSRLSARRAPLFVPAFLMRLEARLRSGAIPPARRESSARYLASKYEVVALMAIRDGRRGVALRLLCKPVMFRRKQRWFGLLGATLLPAAVGEGFQSVRRQLRQRRQSTGMEAPSLRKGHEAAR